MPQTTIYFSFTYKPIEIVHLTDLDRKNPRVDPLLHDNKTKLGLVLFAKLGESVLQLPDFVLRHVSHCSVAHAVAENDDRTGKLVIDL